MSFVALAITERAIDVLKSAFRNPSQDEEIPVVSLSPDVAATEICEAEIASVRNAKRDAPDQEAPQIPP